MKNIILFLTFIFLSFIGTAQRSIKIGLNDHVIDLTNVTWDYISLSSDEPMTYDAVMARNDWKKTKVGKRWEFLYHPEPAGNTVWVKLTFKVDDNLKAYQIGFFATMIDDAGSIYLNGREIDNFKYKTGGKIPHPVNTNFTDYLIWGSENTLVIEIRDEITQRMGGLIGNVCLYKTLPNKLTDSGGIKVNTSLKNDMVVLLHLADVQLMQGEKSTFTPRELEAIKTPPLTLREDELIIVALANTIPQKELLTLDLNNVAPVSSKVSLHLSCDPLPSQIKQYENLRIPISVAGTFDNPFDPKQMNVYALIKTPSGKIEKVSGFFGQDYDVVTIAEEQEILLPIKCNPWKIYYRPRETGVHQVEVFAQDIHQLKHVNAGTFDAIASGAKGYLHPSKQDPRFFEFDNGEPHFGTGPSGWYRGSRFLFGGNIRWVPVTILDNYYKRKKQNNSNFEYLSTFHFGTLYIKDGFVDQHVAWKMEHVLRSMEENDIYWIVFHDGILRSYQNGFETLPYSKAQGGPCNNINEVYTNPVALQMQKNELRYMVSRLADSPSLWIWNCGDESQPGTKYSELMVREWRKELHEYIRQTDIYNHAHSIGENEDALLNGSDVVLLGDWYYHDRKGDKYDIKCNGEKSRNAVNYNLCLQEEFNLLNRPVINIEGGICQWDNFSWLSGEKYLNFPEAIDFHQHLWISFFTKMAAGGTEWLNQVVDQMNELYHAKAISNYLAGEPFTSKKYKMISPKISLSVLQVFGMQTDTNVLVWINNEFYNWYNVGVLKKEVMPVENARISVPVVTEGSYQVELWDTRKGEIVSTSMVKSIDKIIKFTLPPIDKDVALKLKLQ